MKRLLGGSWVPLAVIGLAAFSAPTLSQTTAKPASSPPAYTAVPPAGHEAFFKDMAALMSKYPESAKRFGIADRQVRPPEMSDPKKRRSQCPEGQGCGFYCWTSPSTFECCECNPRPK